MERKSNLTIIQPFITHYREDFFLNLSKKIPFNLLCVHKPQSIESFKQSNIVYFTWLNSFKIGPMIFFNPFNSIICKNEIIVLTANPQWVSFYILLIIKKIIRKKIILWTHGISVKNGFNSNKLRDRIKLFFYNMADGIFLYTEKELDILAPFIKTKMFYLNNTLNVDKISNHKSLIKKSTFNLKKEYRINSSRVVLYCARFIKDRRPDLLLELIEMMKEEDVSFIIIGGGEYKPDFSSFNKVHDFGALYDTKIKAELFSMADISFQPAWVGLSVVESFANGVPFITLKKSKSFPQGVEYNYIFHNNTGFIANNLKDVSDIIMKTSNSEIKIMKKNCVNYVKNNLKLEQMVQRFLNGINETN